MTSTPPALPPPTHAHAPASLPKQCGAAILLAMVTVALVASIASASMADLWRSAEVETAERHRQQAFWLLRGALDWSRLLLRQDAQAAPQTDHPSEPWALPLQPTALGSFLAAQGGSHTVSDASSDLTDAYLAGQMQDLQARLNLLNSVLDQIPRRPEHQRQVRALFHQLGLPQDEANALLQGLDQAISPEQPQRPLMPQRLEDLAWLGISSTSIAALRPHASLLPVATPVNLNTASAAVIAAALPAAVAEQAPVQALLQARQRNSISNLEQARELLGLQADDLAAEYFSVNSQYFEAIGQIRIEDTALAMQAQLQRTGTQISVQYLRSSGIAWSADATP